MALSRFESMLKTNKVYFFDSFEFEEIVHHYIDNGRHPLAKKAVKLGLEQHPNSMLLKLLRAELYVFESKFNLAEKLLNELELIEPTNEEIHIQRASIYSKKNKHKEAITSLKIALKHTNDLADVTSLLAMEYLYLDEFEKARLNFAKCLEVDYEDYSALYNIIYCFDMDEKHEESVAYLHSYLEINPYCEIAWHQLGRQHMILKAYEKAIKAFEYAILIDESFVGAYLEKAKALEVLERYEEAVENYLISIDLDDPTAFVYWRIGDCYKNMNLVKKAILYFKKSVHEDPLLDKAWMALTDVYFSLKEYSKSLYYIKKVISIDEFNPLYWRRYGEINLKLNFFEESITAFRQCLSLDDRSLVIWIALVDVLHYIGDYSEALKILAEAKSYHKEAAEIEYRFFGLFMETNKTKEAFSHLQNGFVLDFEYCNVIKELYPGFFKINQVKKLVAAFQSKQR